MQDFVNRGIYSYSEASKLLRFSAARIRGLVNGYKYPDKERIPVLNKQTIMYDNREYLSFYDLIEIKFIKYFLSKGVSRKEIIESYKKAQKELKKDHPFATRFTTDGQYILADNRKILLAVRSEQFEFREILEQNIYEGIEFENDIPKSWKPFLDLQNIILDPLYKYGQPIVKEYNILTKTLFDTYVAENKNIKTVSEWFDIPTHLIQEAVDFEKRLNQCSLS